MAAAPRRWIGTIAILAVLGIAAAARYGAGPALEERARREAMSLVERLAPPDYDNRPYADVLVVSAPPWFHHPQEIEVFRLRRGGHPAGVVLRSVSAPGYSGPIRIAVSIDSGGQVRGVRVLEHRETPGIGAGVAREDWLAGLRQRSLRDTAAGRWRVRPHGGDFEQLSGATTSAHAVLALVRDCLRLYAEQGESWFASAP